MRNWLVVLVVFSVMAAAQEAKGYEGTTSTPVATQGDAGDLEMVGFSFVRAGEGTYDISLDFYDNLRMPIVIDVQVRKNAEAPIKVGLHCHNVAGDTNTCTGGTGTCSGTCPRRTYDEFPGKTFSGTCKKPRLGLGVCTCTDYKVVHKLGLALPLTTGDQVTVLLDPDNTYDEVSESNNSAVRSFSPSAVTVSVPQGRR